MMKLDNPTAVTELYNQILASKEFANLGGKTQVFHHPKEGVKTRGSHCEIVAEISRRLVEMMGGSTLEQRQAMLTGLVHDLGHIPFGHAGEAVAEKIVSSHSYTEDEKEALRELRIMMFGEEYAKENDAIKFEHNENSAIQFIIMCKRYGYEVDQDIITGILAHSTQRYGHTPPTLVQQAVRLADKLAYINYDAEDLRIMFDKETLERIYASEDKKRRFQDPEGNDILIELPDGRSLTMIEFAQLPPEERVELFETAAVEDAIRQQANGVHKTNLTGCNDIILEESKKKKASKRGEISKEEASKQIAQLQKKLYERSPIMYAAYALKGLSDDFIQAGVGLSEDQQQDRIYNATSAVGNEDLKCEFIYKSLVTLLETTLKKIREKYGDKTNLSSEELTQLCDNNPLIVGLITEYYNFKREQDDALKSLPGNQKGYVMPEVYTIINFLGIHSNADLLEYGEKLNISERYETEVLPLVRETLNNPKFVDDKGIFDKKKYEKARNAIIDMYGARINIHYGIDEGCILPTTPDEIVELLISQGYLVEEEYQQLTNEEKLSRFQALASEEERKYISALSEVLKNARNSKSNNNQEETGRGR